MKGRTTYSIFLCLLVLFGCTGDEPQEECKFDVYRWCGGGYSFSIVNLDTYENLVGEGRLIDPAKIVVTNTRKDTMPTNPDMLSNGWYTINRFNPFDEITCFDQCLSDSAFTRTYYLNYGGADIDTFELYFPTHSNGPQAYFNKLSADVPEDRHDSTGLGHSLYWFRKKVN